MRRYRVSRGRRHTIIKSKVFEVDVCARIELASRLHERVDKLVIPLTSDTFGSEAQIQIIVEKLLVVCTAVQDNRQGSIGVDASTQRGQDELGHGDKDATTALVADTQDFLAV